MSFFKKLGTKKVKVCFIVEVDKVVLPKSHGLDDNVDHLVIAIEKGNRQIQTQDHVVKVSSITKDAVCEIQETLRLDVTLYKEATGLYQEKICKINVYQRRRGMSGLKIASKDSLKSLGVATLPVHGMADGKPYRKVLPLQWSTTDNSFVIVNVHSRLSEESDIDDESVSVTSSSVQTKQTASSSLPSQSQHQANIVPDNQNVVTSSDSKENETSILPASGASYSQIKETKTSDVVMSENDESTGSERSEISRVESIINSTCNRVSDIGDDNVNYVSSIVEPPSDGFTTVEASRQHDTSASQVFEDQSTAQDSITALHNQVKDLSSQLRAIERELDSCKRDLSASTEHIDLLNTTISMMRTQFEEKSEAYIKYINELQVQLVMLAMKSNSNNSFRVSSSGKGSNFSNE